VPFESFLHKTKTKRGVLFHATIAFSVFVHAGALAWATVQSITEVEELPAPQVKLSFMRAPMLAPAVAKPAGGPKTDGPSNKQAPKRDVKPKQPALTQPIVQPVVAEKPPEPKPPTEEPKPVAAAPAEVAHEASGSSGLGGTGQGVSSAGSGVGSTAGAVSGSGGGGPAAAGPRKMLPEALGKMQRLSGAAPAFPAQLAKEGSLFVVMTKVCVSAGGTVETVDLMKRADPTLDKNVIEAVRGWRYKPLLSGETAVPFCTFVRFEFRTE
jgi:outer membrane biosynthesis protein TonB